MIQEEEVKQLKEELDTLKDILGRYMDKSSAMKQVSFNLNGSEYMDEQNIKDYNFIIKYYKEKKE